MPFISEVIYVFHEYELTDHARLLFTLDIKKAEKGSGIFRANPSLLNHPKYKTLIYNVIRFTVIDAIKDKESLLYCQIMDNFNKKIAIQEEIVSLKIMKNKYRWQLEDRVKSQNEEIIVLKTMSLT